MSLEAWSLVIFGTTTLLYMSVFISMFQNPSIKKFFFVFFAWVVHLIATLWYGIATGQIGFVLLFFMELIMIVFVYIITGKVLNNVD